jgi:hypothetical protein
LTENFDLYSPIKNQWRSGQLSISLFERIRRACNEVANRATFIRINYDRIPIYAFSLPLQKAIAPDLDSSSYYLGREKDTLAFLLTLNAINFGSGFFPHLSKRPGMSGFYTIAASLNDFYKKHGPLSAEELAGITTETCFEIFDQDPASEIIRDLMIHFTVALNDLGRYLLDNFNGDFVRSVESAGLSAERLVQSLTIMPYFNDVEPYDNLHVPFYKRAQITVADLAVAFKGQGWGRFDDLDQLTIFADNLVPHVLHVDEILIYDNSLITRINAGELIPAGSPAEVEIRACAIHTVELIKKEIVQAGQTVTSSGLDNLLWNRGQKARYKAIPRHRTRTVYY